MIQELPEYAGLCVKTWATSLQLFSRGPSSSSQLFSVRKTLGREKSGLQFGFSLSICKRFGVVRFFPPGPWKRATYGKGLGFVQVKARGWQIMR